MAGLDRAAVFDFGRLKKEGYSEGTVGPVQTFFLRGQEEP
jgi:hypothetical protein